MIKLYIKAELKPKNEVIQPKLNFVCRYSFPVFIRFLSCVGLDHHPERLSNTFWILVLRSFTSFHDVCLHGFPRLQISRKSTTSSENKTYML